MVELRRDDMLEVNLEIDLELKVRAAGADVKQERCALWSLPSSMGEELQFRVPEAYLKQPQLQRKGIVTEAAHSLQDPLLDLQALRGFAVLPAADIEAPYLFGHNALKGQPITQAIQPPGR